MSDSVIASLRFASMKSTARSSLAGRWRCGRCKFCRCTCAAATATGRSGSSCSCMVRISAVRASSSSRPRSATQLKELISRVPADADVDGVGANSSGRSGMSPSGAARWFIMVARVIEKVRHQLPASDRVTCPIRRRHHRPAAGADRVPALLMISQAPRTGRCSQSRLARGYPERRSWPRAVLDVADVAARQVANMATKSNALAVAAPIPAEAPWPP